MISIEIVDQTALIAFWLIFSRVLPIATQLPIFDNVTIPVMVKVLMSILISYAFYPIVVGEVYKDINAVGVDSFWYLTFFYTVTGIGIGFFVKSLMNIFVSAGSIITQQVGLGAVRYFDPSTSTQIGPFEKLISWTILIMILTSGAIYPMFKGMVGSFSSIHIYDLGKMANSYEFYIRTFKGIFLAGLTLAGPMIFINMLIYSVLGVIARTVPQMNIIMVSFTVNIGVGLLAFVSISNEFFRLAFKVYTDKLGEWFQFII